MANIYSKTEENYRKYITPAYDKAIEKMASQQTIKFENVPKLGTIQAKMLNTPANKQRLEQFRDQAMKGWTKSSKKDGPVYIMIDTDKGTFEFARISTSELKLDAKTSFNRGNVAEGILASCLAARFISKTKKIVTSDVIKVIKQISKDDESTATKSWKSPNANPKILDDIKLLIRLAPHELAATLDANILQGPVKNIVDAGISYANKGTVRDWADLLYNNNRVDTIEIISDGVSDQRGTKVDLFVLINGKRENLNISLKEGSVKQFGQMSGATFDVMSKLFKPLGIKFSGSDEKKFNALLADDKLKMHAKSIAAISYAYQQAAKQLSNSLKNNPYETTEQISKFIKYHATLNEDGVALVQLNNSEAKTYEFDKLLPALRRDNKTLTVSIKDQRITGPASAYLENNTTMPMIVIHPEGLDPNMGLLEIRSKIDNKGAGRPFYHRNYLNKGKYLTKLIAY